MASATRSDIMRAVKDRNTGPEMKVRRLIHAMGYRYRLHRKDLPGKPDLVFPSRKKVIFVHGCFWHGHHCKRGDRLPKTNLSYWTKKIQRNVERDKESQISLTDKGWKILILWECCLNDNEIIRRKISKFLDKN